MSVRTGLVLLLFFPTFGGWQALRAAPPIHVPFPTAAPEVHKDSEGEPLPAGAIARVGSIRLRHSDPADTVTFSPDGKWLASYSSAEHRISIWATADGKPRCHLHLARVAKMAFAPDGNVLAVLVPTGTFTPEVLLECWDLATGRRTLRLRAEERYPEEAVLVFAPDGARLYFGRSTLHRVHLADRRLEYRVPVGSEESGFGSQNMTGLAGTPDGKVLVTAEGGAAFSIRDPETGKRRFQVGVSSLAQAVAISPDARVLAVGTDLDIELWDLALLSKGRTRNNSPVRRLLEHGKKEPTLALAFARDGKTLLSLSAEKVASLWDVALGKCSVHRALPLGQVADVAFDVAQRPLVATENVSPPGLRMWDIREGKELLSDPNLGSPVACMSFSRDGTMLATGHEDKAVRLWQAATGKLLAQGSLPACPGQLDFSADRKALIVGADGRWWKLALNSALSVRKVHLTAKPLEHTAQEWPWKGKLHHGRAAPWRERAAHCMLSPDGFLLEWEPHVLRVLQFESGKSLCEINGNRFQAAALAPNRRTVAVLENDKAIVVHELALEIVPTPSPAAPVAAKPGEAAAVPPPAVQAATGTELDRWELPAQEILPSQPWLRPCHAYVPGGRLLAVGTPRGSILFRDLAVKEQVEKLTGYDKPITLLTFAPDGRTLASAYRDGTILIWHVPALTRKTAPLEPGALASLWRDLETAEAQVAWNAHWGLVGSDQALRLLRERLRPARRADLGPLPRNVEDLSSPRFAVRDRAMKTLAGMGQAAEPALREALKKATSLETQRRLEQLLTRLEEGRRRQVQELRAVAVLEQIATDEARNLLQTLAVGDPQAPLTIAARRACKRLAQ